MIHSDLRAHRPSLGSELTPIGMKDDLTDKVLDTFEPSKQPISLRYVAYGKLSEVMPFLGRRAIENKSVMSGEGGAAAERRRIGDELWRRVFG